MRGLKKKKKQRGRISRKERNKDFMRVLYIYAGLFALLIGYLVYFVAAGSGKILNNPYNTRIELFADKVRRGTIYGCNGEVLAETIAGEDGKDMRYYPYGSLFVHTVGYNSHGKYGIEYSMNYELLSSDISMWEKLINDFKGEKDTGNTVHTTLDAAVQRAAYDALGDYRGAVVALEPDTGRVIAMVSKPDFNPNYISQLWEQLTKTDEDAESGKEAAMLNRATQGLYEPGSVFKIITTLAYMRGHSEWQDFSYTCKGAYSEGNNKISCYHGKMHGRLDIYKAFAVSCNAAFAKLGSELSAAELLSVCEGLGMNSPITALTASAVNRFALAEDAPGYLRLQTMIGQGETQITPLFGAMLAAAVANGGVAMQPYMVETVESPYGRVLKKYEPAVLAEWMSTGETDILETMMLGCVSSGTAYKLKDIEGHACAGKTGTAETQADKPNAWFVGYSMTEGKADIAICVIVEESGTGGDYAVPVAKAALEAYYSNNPK